MNTHKSHLYAIREQDAECLPEDPTRSVNVYRGNAFVLEDSEIPREWLTRIYAGLFAIAGFGCIIAAIVMWLTE